MAACQGLESRWYGVGGIRSSVSVAFFVHTYSIGGCTNDALAIQNWITRTNNTDHASHIHTEA